MIYRGAFMKSVWDFIYKYKYQILLVILYFIFFLQMQNVFFYGDDYEILYPYHNPHDFSNIWNFALNKMRYFWYEWSGRIAGHFTVTFGLSMFGIGFFRILNPIMVFILCYLLVKIYSLFKDCNFYKTLLIISLCVVGLNISISRDTLYWAYSCILYVWFFNLVLLIIYIIYRDYLNNQKISTIKFFILALICSIQSFVLEQITFILLAFLGLMLLFTKRDKTNRKPIVILFVLTIIGFLVSSFCPGNIARLAAQSTELVGFSYFEIILGKCYKFLCYLLDVRCLGSYILILSILVKNIYDNNLKKSKFSLSSIIFYSYFVIVLFNVFFPNANTFLNFANSIDTLEFGNLVYISIILQTFIFGVFFLNLIYMIFKTLDKGKKFFLFAFLISLASALMPILCIRFSGFRYYFYTIITIVILSLLYYEQNKMNHSFKPNNIFLLVICFGFKLPIIITLFLLLVIKIMNKKNSVIRIFKYIILLSLFYNIITTLIGYNKNGIIYRKNIEKFVNAKENEPILLEEIPYEDSLYTWHAIELDYNGIRQYYGFYLETNYE